MNLTPASLKTLRRQGFKKATKYLSQSSTLLCVSASVRETSSPPFPSTSKSNFLSVLPVMDDWEAIRRLKADPETTTVPIIALTAHARAEDEKTARQAGANDLDTKPINFNRLVGKIEHLLTPPATGTLPENP
jgi:DNA-binding NarL/FixJ family response regulator